MPRLMTRFGKGKANSYKARCFVRVRPRERMAESGEIRARFGGGLRKT